MKKLFLLIILLWAGISVQAHCYSYTCSTFTDVTGSVAANYIGSKCFNSTGSGATFTTATNFNDWSYLYFSSNTTVQGTLNMTGVRKLFFYGTNSCASINMDGSDTIKNDGTLTINNLVSNGSVAGHYNVIYTNSRVNIRGTWYYPKDTFFSTPGAATTAVVITDCAGVSLPLNLLLFTGQIVDGNAISISWMLANKELTASVEYSTDGVTWSTIAEYARSPFVITQTSALNLVRIKAGGEYSTAKVFRIDQKDAATDLIYDLMGRKLEYVPADMKMYIKNGKLYYNPL